MNGINPERPEFTAAIRGYDRPQVDEYIERLHELVADAEDRAQEAVSELEYSRHSNVGPRVTEIFELAVAEAKEIRAKTDADCDQARADARAEVDRLLTAGDQEASEIQEQAERKRDEVMAELQAERNRANMEVARLEEVKKNLLAELRRLHEALAAAAQLGGAGAYDPVEEDAEEDETEQADAA